MLYLLAEYLGFPSGFNLIRYLSFRSGAAVATALVIGLLIGPKFIGMLRVRQARPLSLMNVPVSTFRPVRFNAH